MEIYSRGLCHVPGPRRLPLSYRVGRGGGGRFTQMLPWIGRRLSGHPTAYNYLPASVIAYPSPEGFSQLMAEAGLEGVGFRRLTGGIVTLHVGTVRGGNGTGE